MRYAFGIVLFMVFLTAAYAEQITEVSTKGGEVRLPREIYNDLLEKANELIQNTDKDEAPSYAFGKASLIITVLEENDRMTGYIDVRIPVTTYSNSWTSIPLIDANTALTVIDINEQAAQLTTIDGKFVWQTNTQGDHIIKLSYIVDTKIENNKILLNIPMPSATSTLLEASIPGLQLGASISEAVGTVVSESYDRTQVRAHISPDKQPVLSWNIPSIESNYSISRAIYKGQSKAAVQFMPEGQFKATTIVWEADILVESFTDSEILLPLLDTSIALHQVYIEDKEATVLVDKDKFAIQIAARGLYKLKLRFQTPIVEITETDNKGCENDAKWYTTMRIPKTPISRFHIDIEGQQRFSVIPNSNVTVDLQNHYSTRITTYVPMTSRVTFCLHQQQSDFKVNNTVSNGEGYHAIYPEENVLRGLSLLKFNVLRGSSSTFNIKVPYNVLIKSIAAENDLVLHWIENESKTDKNKAKIVTIYVDREIDDQGLFIVKYEQAISRVSPVETEKVEASGGGETAANTEASDEIASSSKSGIIGVSVPGLLQVTRQSHYVALLNDPSYKLQPEDRKDTESNDGVQITKVGQQVLPEFFSSRLKNKIRYIYKYHLGSEAPIPTILVRMDNPDAEKKTTFDAQISSLISVGESLIEGMALIELTVTNKNTQGINNLRLHLPKMPDELQELTLTCAASVECVDNRDTDVYGLVLNIDFKPAVVKNISLILSYKMNFSWENANEILMPITSIEGASFFNGFFAISLKSDKSDANETTLNARQKYSNQLGIYAETLNLEDTGKIWPMQINKLPEPLLQEAHRLKRPILRAFRYTYLGAHYLLPLELGRYETTRPTKISEAHYETLFGKQGGVYTQVTYEVENAQSQLLEIKLPKNAQLISVTVGGYLDGQAKERARTAQLSKNSILVRLIKSNQPFTIKMQYSYEGTSLGFWYGYLKEYLPILKDSLVGHLVWDVYLPSGAYYQVMPNDTNLEVLRSNLDINVRKMKYIFKNQTFGEDNRWIGFRFSQIYSDDQDLAAESKINISQANQSKIDESNPEFNDAPQYSMMYVSTAAQVVGQVISLFSTFLIGSALILFTIKANQVLHIVGILMVSSGTASMVYAIAVLEADMMPTVYVGSIFTTIIVGVWTWQLWTVINQDDDEEEKENHVEEQPVK